VASTKPYLVLPEWLSVLQSVADAAIVTVDRNLRSQMLYPAELRARGGILSLVLPEYGLGKTGYFEKK
jgi:hypothetical protein